MYVFARHTDQQLQMLPLVVGQDEARVGVVDQNPGFRIDRAINLKDKAVKLVFMGMFKRCQWPSEVTH